MLKPPNLRRDSVRGSVRPCFFFFWGGGSCGLIRDSFGAKMRVLPEFSGAYFVGIWPGSQGTHIGVPGRLAA